MQSPHALQNWRTVQSKLPFNKDWSQIFILVLFYFFLGGGGGGAGQLADWYRVAGYINSMAKQSMAIKMMCLGSRRSTTSSGLLFLGKDLEAQ